MAADARVDEVKDPRAAPAGLWVVTTYFGQGFPYSIVINLANLYFTAQGASLQAIGLTSLFHLPWNLKAFVGPFFDAYGTKRRWLVGIELLLSIALVIFAFVAGGKDVLTLASVMFLTVAVLSASHDIAIDGLYLEALDKHEQELLVGWRAPAWRVGQLVVTGGMAIVCDKVGWTVGFFAMAGVLVALFLFHAFFLPRTEKPKLPMRALLWRALTPRFLLVAVAIALVVLGVRAVTSSDAYASAGAWMQTNAPTVAKLGAADVIAFALLAALLILLALLPFIRARIETSNSTYARSFVSFLAQPYAGRILAYVLLFRLGESFLQTMRFPFVHKALDMSQSEYGVAQGTFGVIAGLAAPIVGGAMISQYGLRRCIAPFLAAQNGFYLVFCAAAVFAPEIKAATTPLYGSVIGGLPTTLVDVRLLVATIVIVIENIGAGLGTSVFLVYLIRCCMPEHKAAHMALLTSLMSISFTMAGVFSGFFAEWLGFPLYFAGAFLITIPGMVLTLFVPHIDERGAKPILGR